MEHSASMTAETTDTAASEATASGAATTAQTGGDNAVATTALRLSPQQRLSWLAQMPAAHMILALNGTLDEAWLRQRMQQLVGQHEALRSRLLAVPGLHVPLQTIAAVDSSDHSPGNSDIKIGGISINHERSASGQLQLHISLSAHCGDRGTLLRLAQALGDVAANQPEMGYSQYSAWLYDLQLDEDAANGYAFWADQPSSSSEFVYRTRPPRRQLRQQRISEPGLREPGLEEAPVNSTGHNLAGHNLASYNLASHSLELDAATLARLRDGCRQLEGAADTMSLDQVLLDEVLMTAWAVLLQRLSSAGDGAPPQLVLNWQHDCRDDYEQLADCWGLFSKALPLHWQCALEHSFQHALAQLRAARENASEWQEYHAIEHEPAVAQLRFGFEWGGEWQPQMLNTTPLHITQIQAQSVPYELLLIPRLVQRDGNTSAVLELSYDADRYNRHTARVLLEQLLSLLQSALHNPTARLCDLALHSASFEQHLAALQPLQQPSQTLHDLDQNALFPHQFTQVAVRYPQQTALCDSPASVEIPAVEIPAVAKPLRKKPSTDEGSPPAENLRRITYGELEQRSNQWAHALHAAGIGPESRVALFLERGSEMIVAMLAVMKAGGAFVPLEIQQPAARNLAILTRANPQVLLTQSHLTPPNVPGLQPLNLDDPAIARQPTTPPPITINPRNAAYVLFTSGSTGTPKGVVVEHRQLHYYIHNMLRHLDLQAGDRCALVTSLAADLSYTLLFPGLLSAASLHIVARETVMNRATWAAYQQRHAIDHIKMVPTLLAAWLGDDNAQTHENADYPDQSHNSDSHGQGQAYGSGSHKAALNPASVLPGKTLLLGGESFSAGLLNRIRRHAPQLTVFNHYGPTETTVGVLVHRCEPDAGHTQFRQPQYRPVPLTQRLDGTRIYLLDEQQQPVAPGQIGELFIAGAQVARGYLPAATPTTATEQNPSTTPPRFLPDPWVPGERLYRSGDLARYQPDGAIEIIGRADRQVKIRGFRVELDEIETQLVALPGVRQAAVEAYAAGPGDGTETGTEGGSGGEAQGGNLQLFAFVTFNDTTTRVAALHSQLQERLPDYMVPTLRVVDELPLMANGKLDRPTLRRWAGQMQQHRCITPPRNALETLLAQHWAEVLGLQQVGIDDDFFQLGGHSLAAVKLASRLHNALKLPINVNAIFSAPTVARFAAQLNEQHEQSPAALVPLSPVTTDALTDAAADSTSRPNLFCFHPSTGLVHDYQPVAASLEDWRVWGLQAVHLGQQSTDTASLSIAQLARDYVAQIRHQQPRGPYHLLGWSLGGLIAASAAEILEASGESVAFLGLVDTQWPGQGVSANAQTADQDDDEDATITALMATAIAELDAVSRQRVQALEPAVHERLRQELAQYAAQDRLRHLVQWAQNHGLQRAQGSWQQLLLNLDYRPHTQQLLASFQPPQLRCAVHAWWAEASLNQARTNRDGSQTGFTPLDCAAISDQPVVNAVIAAQHFTVLQHAEWQQQLAAALAALNPLASVGSSGAGSSRADLSHSTGEPT